MLKRLEPNARRTYNALPFDERLLKLVKIAREGKSLEAGILEVAKSLGFDNFMYGMSLTEPRPHQKSPVYVWTTLPPEWVELYDSKSYVEVDPGLTHTWNRTAPYMWDANRIRGEWQVQDFLADAARYGIRSGVVVSFRDAAHARIIVALHSSISPVSAERYEAIKNRLGEIMLLATCFHDLFMAYFVGDERQPASPRVKLSTRQQQCLELAAHGMTSSDIAHKLGITERTANFHFSSVKRKLGVLNRHEAIARAIVTGMISLQGHRC